jgi:hypothetical protein
MKIVKSVQGVPIRLTPERLAHIAARHIEMNEFWKPWQRRTLFKKETRKR